MQRSSLVVAGSLSVLLGYIGCGFTGESHLQSALGSGSKGEIESVLRRGVDVNAPLANGQMPLAFAIDKGNLSAVQLLLASGANPEIQDHGVSMLSLAVNVRPCSSGIVRALLVAGEDPNQKDTVSSGPPILTALEFGAEVCAEVLLSHGANIHSRDVAGGTALDAAIQGSSKEMVERLIAAGLDVNSVMAQQTTPLMWAALRRPDAKGESEAIIDLLLIHGANPCFTDVHGMTASDLARKSGFRIRASRLKSACAR